MERNVRILWASVNPSKYDIKTLGELSFDEALDFFEKDDNHYCTYGVENVNLSRPNEFKFHAIGVVYGDGSDTMLNWCKVE